MKVNRVLFVAPGRGNGGIRAWAKKVLANFNNGEYELVHIGVGTRRNTLTNSFIKRVVDGLLDLIDKMRAIISEVRKDKHISLMHITTSGNLGTVRDYVLAKYCKRHHIKTIMHCHYGCISIDYHKKSFIGTLLRKTMRLYDQIWVLDSYSYAALESDPDIADKVYLTPNSIEVPSNYDIQPKTYKKIAYVGILLPSKGLYELIEAVKQCSDDTTLTIAGSGEEVVVNDIRDIADHSINGKIKFVGSLSNEDAIALIKSVDIIALPTYYISEAFPISILEAMSYGKMVISTPRAAIKDMLTALDGTECGCLVRERSVEDIVESIEWCQQNSELADKRCAKAYEKVNSCYREDVVYDLYRSLYRKAIME